MSILWTPAVEGDGEAQLLQLQKILAHPPGFMSSLSDESAIQAVEEIAETVPEEDSILLLGIGGSALGAQALASALAPESADRLNVLDNVDADSVDQVLSRLDLQQTTVLVISKSGATAETSAQLLRIMAALKSAGVDPDQKIIAITDPEKGPLRQLATERKWRSLAIPADVGGRFSVMTAVGWLPAMLIGIDIRELIGGASKCLADLQSADKSHGLVQWAANWAQLSVSHRIVVLFPYRDRLRTFGDWFAQLWAESLGKRTNHAGDEIWTGSTPLVARGVTDQHSLVQLFAEGPDDKQYVFLDAPVTAPDPPIPAELANLHSDLNYLSGKTLDQLRLAEWEGTIAALRSAGRPVSTLQLEKLDAAHMGALILLWKVMTLLAAEVLKVNPFDQPGVEAGKAIAFAKMGREGWQEQATKIMSAANTPASTPPIDC